MATDADGDAILYTYDWSDSTGNQQTTTEVSDTSDVFLAGGLTEDTWTCDVTPYDGTDYGSAMSGSATVESGCSSLDFDGNSNNVVLPSNLTSNLNSITLTGWFYANPNQSTYANVISQQHAFLIRYFNSDSGFQSWKFVVRLLPK